MNSNLKDLIIIMDGHALVHRAWHGIQQPLTLSSTGEEVGAIFGFLNSLFRTLNDYKPKYCAITFDLPYPTFRHEMFKEYKSHRPPTPQELINQFDKVKEAIKILDIPIYEIKGYEGDDVLGALSEQAEKQQVECMILTGDTDTLQLVSPFVKVLLSHGSQKKTLYDEKAVEERYEGLGSKFIPEIKALQGDSSDNIPGVPGVGAKTAIKLLKEYNSIDGIYKNINDLPQGKIRSSLIANEELAYKCKELTTIKRAIPINLNLEHATFWTFKKEELVGFLNDLEFYSLISRIPKIETIIEHKSEILKEKSKYSFDQDVNIIIDDQNKLEKMYHELLNADNFSFDTETTSTNPMSANLVGISFANSNDKTWYLPLRHKDQSQKIDLNISLKYIKDLLENKSIKKYVHNGYYDASVLLNDNIKVNNISFDSMIAAHLLGKRSIGLKPLVLEYFKHEMTDITELIGKGKNQTTIDNINIKTTALYAMADAYFTQKLSEIFYKELDENNLLTLYNEIEIKLIPLLIHMQRTGITIDKSVLKNLSDQLSSRLTDITNKTYSIIGHEFNLNSPQQLSSILFDELKLPTTKKNKLGYSTNAAELENLRNQLNKIHSDKINPKSIEVLDSILEFRQLSKLKSTYADSLPLMINPITQKIHPNYNQAGTTTGRLSSNDPNIQNIPIRTPIGNRVRKAFIVNEYPDELLLSADYSQIELRVLAHISEDPSLIKAFKENEDIHSSTASSVYNVPLKSVTDDMRRIAKIMNFGVLYGLSPYGISQQTNLTPTQGSEFISAYFNKYPKIKSYIENTKNHVKQFGYVQTLSGRKRYIPEINSPNHQIRASAERMAINLPIQGTAADMIKIAMININKFISNKKLKTKMIIQVHDELIFQVPKDELNESAKIIIPQMESAMKLKIPISVDTKIGPNWGELKGINFKSDVI
tara:strand:- start:77395 stop:80199 length:2805 start_codon:yes stop_codon:yes gene_type:complete